MNSILRISWTVSCVFATLSTMVWQLLNYYNGEEQTIVEYRRFNEMETDGYPSLTLCWHMGINEEKLKMYGSKFNSLAYGKFLHGDAWDEDMLKVDYEDVMLNLNDNILFYGYTTSSQKTIKLYNKFRGTKEKPGFKQSSHFSNRCFTLDIPFVKGKEISTFLVYFKSSMFGKHGRFSNGFSNGYLKRMRFQLTLHYRNGFIRKSNPLSGTRTYWPMRANGSSTSYIMQLTVGNIDVLVKRSTRQKPCIEGVPEHDKNVIEHMMKKVGCKPPYWNSTSSLDLCSSQGQLQELIKLWNEAALDFNSLDFDGGYFSNFKPPCRTLERINYDVLDLERPKDGSSRWQNFYDRWLNDSVGIHLHFTELTYKEVKHVPGMDVQALIGKLQSSDIPIKSI